MIGESGVGKAALLWETCHYMIEWAYFKHGIIFVSLIKCFTIDQFISQIAESLKVSSDEKIQGISDTLQDKEILIFFEKANMLIQNHSTQLYKILENLTAFSIKGSIWIVISSITQPPLQNCGILKLDWLSN